MNEHKSQAELLDLYLEALTHDPQAPVPPGLNEKMAAFARQLMDAEQTDTPVLAMQQRVWEKMMVAAQKSTPSVSSNGRTHSSFRPLNMEDTMNYTSTYDHTPRAEGQLTQRRVNVSLVAAALIVVVFVATILFSMMSPKDGSTLGAVGLQSSNTPESDQLDATATATFQETPTPQPSDTSPMGFTLPPYQSALIPLEMGVSVEGALTGDEPAYFYLIQGKAGDLLTVTVNASDLVSMGYFLQYVPQVGGGSNSGGGGGGGGGGGSAGQPTTQMATIPVSVDSAIIFSVNNDTGGSPVTYSIELGNIDVPQLTYDETYTDSYDPSRLNWPYAYYDFVGQRGDIVDIVVESETMDGVLSLKRLGDDRELTSDDDSGAGVNPEIELFQLPADGTYRIEVYPINIASSPNGEFSITVFKHEPIILVPNEVQQIALSNKYTARVLSFEGQAGQIVEFNVDFQQNSTLTSFSIEQNGTVLDQVLAYPVMGGSKEDLAVGDATQHLISEFTIPADGTVVIFVNSDVSTLSQDNGIAGYPTFIDVFDVVVRNQ